jgi:hypothetical protein
MVRRDSATARELSWTFGHGPVMYPALLLEYPPRHSVTREISDRRLATRKEKQGYVGHHVWGPVIRDVAASEPLKYDKQLYPKTDLNETWNESKI